MRGQSTPRTQRKFRLRFDAEALFNQLIADPSLAKRRHGLEPREVTLTRCMAIAQGMANDKAQKDPPPPPPSDDEIRAARLARYRWRDPEPTPNQATVTLKKSGKTVASNKPLPKYYLAASGRDHIPVKGSGEWVIDGFQFSKWRTRNDIISPLSYAPPGLMTTTEMIESLMIWSKSRPSLRQKVSKLNPANRSAVVELYTRIAPIAPEFDAVWSLPDLVRHTSAYGTPGRLPVWGPLSPDTAPKEILDEAVVSGVYNGGASGQKPSGFTKTSKITIGLSPGEYVNFATVRQEDIEREEF